MFNEMIFNLVNVGLAAWVVWMGFTYKLSGALKTVGMYIAWVILHNLGEPAEFKNMMENLIAKERQKYGYSSI
jgi:hypothetical protein